MKHKTTEQWKAVTILFLALILCLSLCACSEGTDAQPEIETPDNGESTAVDVLENEELYINIPFEQAAVESFITRIIDSMDANAEMIYDEDEGAYAYKYKYGDDPAYECKLWVQRPGYQKQKIQCWFLEDTYGLSHEVRCIVLEDYGGDSQEEVEVVAEAIEQLLFGYSEAAIAFASCEYQDRYEYEMSKMTEEYYACSCFVERYDTRNGYHIRDISLDE